MTQVTPLPRNTAIPSAVPTTPVLPTPSGTPKPTLQPSPTHTPTPTTLDLADIPSGLYVVTVSESSLNIRTLEGELLGPLATGRFYMPSLSPDLMTIAFASENGPFAFLDMSSNEVSFYEPYEMLFGNPSWSPDGSMLVIEALDDRVSIVTHLRILDVGSMQDWRITFWSSGEFDPAWSPDGKWIAFASDHLRETLELDLFLLDASCINEPETCADGIIGPLTSERTMSVSEPAWSPDSRRLACNCTFLEGETLKVDLCVVDIETGQIEKLIDSPNLEVLPNWSHDGRWIAFQRDYADSIFIVHSDGSDQRLISQEGKFAFWMNIP